jgi:hypothetical protein
MQLADELPMLALVLGAVCGLLRFTWPKLASLPSQVFSILFVGLSSALLATDRLDDATGEEQMIHQACRGIMTCAFSACFLYIFYSTAQLSSDDAQTLRKRNASCGVWSPPGLFRRQFVIWIASIVGWIADILCCAALQNLPFGVPFPQLHGLVWHGGSALGLHYIMVLLVWHQRLEDGFSPKSKLLLGFLPYLVEE